MTIRLVQFTDVHFGVEHKAALAAATQFVHDDPPDLVIVSGDITQTGAWPQFAAAKTWFDSLATPRFIVPGNHDTPYYDPLSRLVAPWNRYSRYFGPTWSSYFAEGLAVRGTNTARGVQARWNWSKGAIRAEASRKIARELRGMPKAALKVVVTHHPLMEVVGGPITGKVRGGEDAARRFAEAGCDLIVSGHIHVPFVEPLPFDDCRTYQIGGTTLSIRERGSPVGFNLIEADESQIIVKAMAWTGSGFAIDRTWGLDRRQSR